MIPQDEPLIDINRLEQEGLMAKDNEQRTLLNWSYENTL